MATITSVNISKHKGVQKEPVGPEPQNVIVDFGVENDAHAGDWHRQVSFLAEESIAKARDMGLDVSAGDFAENFTTEGIDLLDLPLGTQLRLGSDVLVEISQIGKAIRAAPFIILRATASSRARGFSRWFWKAAR